LAKDNINEFGEENLLQCIMNEIEKARKILKLSEKASIADVKNSYKKLVKKYHPDKCRDEKKKFCEKKIKEINKAYETIMEYCLNYRIPLRNDLSKKQDISDKEHMDRFYNGWWADNPEKK